VLDDLRNQRQPRTRKASPRKTKPRNPSEFRGFRERATGVEPATLCLASIRSSQLSYARVPFFLAEDPVRVKKIDGSEPSGQTGFVEAESSDPPHPNPLPSRRGNRARIASKGRWRQWARRLRAEVRAIRLACSDPRTPWYARAVAVAVLAYAVSPIDLSPDFIPVLGHLDDLLIVPLGLWLALRLIPADVLAECRARASAGDD
jgi:uncharacterized membrane protein YkvA (DUF1232 family)